MAASIRTCLKLDSVERQPQSGAVAVGTNRPLHPLLMAAQRCRPDGHFRQEV